MFVFVYIPPAHTSWFPHLVVILTTLGTPKNVFCFNNNIINDNSKQDHPGKNKFGCTLFAELCGRDMRALPQIFRLFWIPKKSLLKSSDPKNTCQIFLPKKILESKISNPKKILRSSPSLEIWSTPPLGLALILLTPYMYFRSYWNPCSDPRGVVIN